MLLRRQTTTLVAERRVGNDPIFTRIALQAYGFFKITFERTHAYFKDGKG